MINFKHCTEKGKKNISLSSFQTLKNLTIDCRKAGIIKKYVLQDGPPYAKHQH